jgi:3-oxoacyl-[acyl-carrier protein] reductase
VPLTIDFSNETALITGASQGLGEAIARRLHHAGCRVLLNHPGLENTREDAQRTIAELNKLRPDSALEMSADVGDADAVQAMMQSAKDQCGGIDFLINNAAILRDRSVSKMSLDEWHDAIQVNLNGVFYCCKFGLEIMRDGGAIINLSSISAILGFYGQANYAAAKAGVASLAKVLARECGKRNIRANAVAPGIIETAMTQTIPKNVRDAMLESIPLARMGKPDEVADVVLFLCSPLASYINGQIIEINGGWRG